MIISNIITVLVGIAGILASYIFYKRGRKSMAEEISPAIIKDISDTLSKREDCIIGCNEENIAEQFNRRLLEASVMGKTFKETAEYIKSFYTKFAKFGIEHSSPFGGYNYQHFVSDSSFNEKDPYKNDWEKLREEFQKGCKKMVLRDLLNR